MSSPRPLRPRLLNEHKNLSTQSPSSPLPPLPHSSYTIPTPRGLPPQDYLELPGIDQVSLRERIEARLYHPHRTGPWAGLNQVPGFGLGHSLCGSSGLVDCSTDLELGRERLNRQEARHLALPCSSRTQYPPQCLPRGGSGQNGPVLSTDASCSLFTPPPPVSTFSKGEGVPANIPLGAKDGDTVALVPATVWVSGHEAAMAAPTIDVTQVQGHLAHLPLGAYIQFPLE